MSSAQNAQSWEGFVVAVCAVGGFGITIYRMLKKARKEQIDDAIRAAKIKQDLEDTKKALEQERRHHHDG